MRETNNNNININRTTEYNENRWRFLHGFMSAEEWTEYTQSLLVEIMNENKDVLIRLKNR